MAQELSNTQAAQPPCNPSDLGQPIPDEPHAVSVCLPTWESVVRYEEGDAAVTNALQTGYPRFVLHKEVLRLAEQFKATHPQVQDSFCLPFPTEESAKDCLRFCHAGGIFRGAGELLEECAIAEFRGANANAESVSMLVVPDVSEIKELVRAYWQHTGRIVSSRRAQDLAEGKKADVALTAVDTLVREDIASLSGCPSESIRLYPSGMAAIYAAFCLVRDVQDVQAGSADAEKKTVQFGFPYVDTDKIQSKTDSGRILLSEASENDLQELERLVAAGQVSAVFTEFPSNPLLSIPDLKTLSAILRPAGIPLVVDETLASFANADVSPYADLIATSLTKYYSGSGTVMGGSLIVSETSPLRNTLLAQLEKSYVNECYAADVALLATQGGQRFLDRMQGINTNAAALAAHLESHPLVQKVHFPGLSDAVERFTAVQRQDGGFGGLLSIELVDPEKTTRPFFDALQLAKGPSLGTEFTLICLYTLLAHYNELDEVAKQGVSRHLIRVSVGSRESVEQLCQAFDQAFETADKFRSLV